ncbi:TIGR00730 family Rossman fold protein [Longispora albida]|uniref:LOG family protein n=1 Tax=Longispora albida TaxID=203523 RepID=UPI00036460B0|nr:TIGR00730 family Rossman fold protein [Longispora albida]
MAAVCVFCASSVTVAQSYLDLARETGIRLAEAGHTLVSGGARVGMMGAVTSGARSAGGYTVGIIVEALAAVEIADTGSDELVVAGSMLDRKGQMIDRSDAFLVLPGGLGTLDELFEVWTTAGLGMHAKPVVVVNAGGFYDGLLTWLGRLVTLGMVREAALESLIIVDTLDGALAQLATSLKEVG